MYLVRRLQEPAQIRATQAAVLMHRMRFLRVLYGVLLLTGASLLFRALS